MESVLSFMKNIYGYAFIIIYAYTLIFSKYYYSFISYILFLMSLRFYAFIPIIVRSSIMIGMTTTNSIVLIMTRPVAKGKSDFASFATIGNTAITGPAD